MLMNLTAMARANVLTVRQGWIQAIIGPVAYMGFLPNFKHMNFSVDGKTLASALKTLEEDFRAITHENGDIQIFDSEQEIIFKPQAAEMMLTPPKGPWQIYNLAESWTLVDKFIHTQFPGIRAKHDYLEVLSDQSIVRVHVETTFKEPKVYSQAKITKKAQAYCIYKKHLWLRYSPSDFVIISELDNVIFPSTDQYFVKEQKANYKRIPLLVKEKLLPCDTVEFKDGNLLFKKQDIAKASVEGIDGFGEYNYTLFAKVVKYASHWAMMGELMYFSGSGFSGVIENLNGKPF